jgi:predicted transcriptional regulator
MFKAKHIMNTRVVTVRPEEGIDRAITLIAENKVSSLPVVDGEEKLVGTVSELDLLALVFDCWTKQDNVGHYMSTDFCHVDLEVNWTDVADVFRSGSIRQVPVTHEAKLVGTISAHDLLRAIRDSRELVSQVLAQQTLVEAASDHSPAAGAHPTLRASEKETRPEEERSLSLAPMP